MTISFYIIHNIKQKKFEMFGGDFMHMEHLKYLLRVAEIGSITKASKILYINQQQLSKIVQSLEASFGCKIFERTNAGVKPTAKGQDILNTINDIAKLFDALILRLNEDRTNNPQDICGELIVNSTLSYWDKTIVNQAMSTFIEMYPNVNVIFNELPSSKVIKLVAEHEGQVGFISIDASNTIAPVSIPQTVKYIPLYQTKLGVIAGKDSDYAKTHKSASLNALAKEKLVVYASNGESSFDLLFQTLNNIKAEYSTNTLNAFYQILHSGRAIALSIKRNDDFLESKNLSFIPIRENIAVECGLIVPEDYQDNFLINAFVNFAIQQARNR